MAPDAYKIPYKLNLAVTIVCSVGYFLLLYLASHASHYIWMLGCAVVFAFMMVPVYSLIHEAEHQLLHPHDKTNTLLGRWLCMLFIVPYTFMKHCHLKHHKKNRTDEEMWDLYYEHQNKWKRYGNMYGMMVGIGYFALWLSVLLFATWPRLLYTRFFRSKPEIAGFIRGSDTKEKIRKSTYESWAIIVFQVAVFMLLDLHWQGYLLLFTAHGFLWSSQNYVNHAFSPRDIINGAHNLRMPAWGKWVYLNFNLHQAHHQHPQIPWVHLPAFVNRGSQRMSFFRNYLELWKGPKLTNVPEPVKQQVQENDS
ncbi:fatty acid desaturase [Pontibacter toksunensis]|uniref:Fatty acid desaturase n=1 Tax=Pontibacter toksunensis TaxID=1332631 RepID=A0ABW6C163_9BACT